MSLRNGSGRPKFNVIEKTVIVSAMIILVPAVRLLLWIRSLSVESAEWIKLEWRKLDMSPEELAEFNRRRIMIRLEEISDRLER